MSSDLYRELGENGILVKINISDADCDSFQGQVISNGDDITLFRLISDDTFLHDYRRMVFLKYAESVSNTS